jgi:hypothetical protein
MHAEGVAYMLVAFVALLHLVGLHVHLADHALVVVLLENQ